MNSNIWLFEHIHWNIKIESIRYLQIIILFVCEVIVHNIKINLTKILPTIPILIPIHIITKETEDITKSSCKKFLYKISLPSVLFKWLFFWCFRKITSNILSRSISTLLFCMYLILCFFSYGLCCRSDQLSNTHEFIF